MSLLKYCLVMLVVVTFSVFTSTFAQGEPHPIVVKWSHDKQKVAEIMSDWSIRIRDAMTGQVIRSLWTLDIVTNDVAWSSDDTYLATGGWDTLNIWDVATGNLLHSFDNHQGSIQTILWQEDDTEIFAATEGDGTSGFYLWDVNSQNLIASNNVGAAFDSALKPDGTQIALAALGGGVALINPSTLSLEELIRISGSDFESEWTAFRIAWHPSGNMVASGHVNGSVRIWDLAEQELLETLPGTTTPFAISNTVRALRFSDDGNYLQSVNGEGYVKVWETDTWELVAEQSLNEPITGADWNDEGKLVVASDDPALQIISSPYLADLNE